MGAKQSWHLCSDTSSDSHEPPPSPLSHCIFGSSPLAFKPLHCEILENSWHFQNVTLAILENSWKLLKIIENYWKFLKLLETSWKLLKFLFNFDKTKVLWVFDRFWRDTLWRCNTQHRWTNARHHHIPCENPHLKMYLLSQNQLH